MTQASVDHAPIIRSVRSSWWVDTEQLAGGIDRERVARDDRRPRETQRKIEQGQLRRLREIEREQSLKLGEHADVAAIISARVGDIAHCIALACDRVSRDAVRLQHRSGLLTEALWERAEVGPRNDDRQQRFSSHGQHEVSALCPNQRRVPIAETRGGHGVWLTGTSRKPH